MTEANDRVYPGGLLLVALDGTILDAPPFFANALDVDERLSPTVFELFDSDHFPFLSFKRVFRRPDGVMEYHVTVHREMEENLGFRYWDLTPNQGDENGSPIAFYVVDDTSVLQAADWEFRRLRRYVLDDVRTYIVSEFKDRIAALRVLTDTGAGRPEWTGEAMERADELVRDLQEVVARIDEDFEMSVPDGVDQELPMKLSEIPNAMASWSDGRVEIEAHVVDIDDDVYVEASVLEGVLQPVVRNAIESEPQGQLIDVEVERLPGGFVCFVIADHGQGMTPHELTRAEDPFFTTKSGHAGLGLSTARESLRGLGGYWNFKSSVEEGTTVRICVPSMSVEEFFQ